MRDDGLRFWLRFRFWFRNRFWLRLRLGFGFGFWLRFGRSEIYEIFFLPLNNSEGERLPIKRINGMRTSNL